MPPLDEDDWRALLTPESLVEDVLAALNAGELARRRFRDIARISGLVFQGYPGKGKTGKQLQASSGLLYDTLDRYDPAHLLLDQARREVLESQLEIGRLRAVLERARDQTMVLTAPSGSRRWRSRCGWSVCVTGSARRAGATGWRA